MNDQLRALEQRYRERARVGRALSDSAETGRDADWHLGHAVCAELCANELVSALDSAPGAVASSHDQRVMLAMAETLADIADALGADGDEPELIFDAIDALKFAAKVPGTHGVALLAPSEAGEGDHARLPVDHAAALTQAMRQQTESNLARAYIEFVAQEAAKVTATPPAAEVTVKMLVDALGIPEAESAFVVEVRHSEGVRTHGRWLSHLPTAANKLTAALRPFTEEGNGNG